MKFLLIPLSAMILSSVAHGGEEPRIEAFKAAFHVGKSVMACGKVAEVKESRNVIYMNLDKPYPNQTLGVLIWSSDRDRFEQRFGKLSAFRGERVCARGKIEDYQGHLQIKLSNPQLLRLIK